jgi:hypothetical protein
MKIGPAYSCTADPHDYVGRASDFWFGHILVSDEIPPAQAGVVAGEYRRFHE